jgi:hypothetical protein
LLFFGRFRAPQRRNDRQNHNLEKEREKKLGPRPFPHTHTHTVPARERAKLHRALSAVPHIHADSIRLPRSHTFLLCPKRIRSSFGRTTPPKKGACRRAVCFPLSLFFPQHPLFLFVQTPLVAVPHTVPPTPSDPLLMTIERGAGEEHVGGGCLFLVPFRHRRPLARVFRVCVCASPPPPPFPPPPLPACRLFALSVCLPPN